MNIMCVISLLCLLLELLLLLRHPLLEFLPVIFVEMFHQICLLEHLVVEFTLELLGCLVKIISSYNPSLANSPP